MKKLFIIAYCYTYGSTKKKAAEVCKTATPEYIAAIIEGFRQDSRAGFLND